MAYVITRLCRDCKDMGCIDVCPTDCIVEHAPEGSESDLPNQLFIHPEDCIDCRMCVPECPWDAIFAEEEVPEEFRPDVALNALVRERRADFRVPHRPRPPLPKPEDVAENKRRWGATG